MESTFPSQNLRKDPCATFIRMDGVLLEVRNRKEGCCPWSLVAITSCILAIKLTASIRLISRSLSSLFQILDWLPLIVRAYRSPSPKCTPWSRLSPSHIVVISQVPSHDHYAMLALVHRRCWESTLHGGGLPSSHVAMISPVSSCIHSILLSKWTTSPITSEAHFSLEVCTPTEDVLSRHRHSKKLFSIQSI
jgi:hypothetical protein